MVSGQPNRDFKQKRRKKENTLSENFKGTKCGAHEYISASKSVKLSGIFWLSFENGRKREDFVRVGFRAAE